jgi:hypothetical protein
MLMRGLPAVLGVRDFDGAFAHGFLGLTFAAAVVVGTIVALIRLRGSWFALARGHVARAKPAACLFVFALITTVVYTECRPTTLRLERYLVPFATATIPLMAMVIDWLLERRRVLGGSQLGAAFFIPTAIVPPLLITHGLIFWLLVRPGQ